jgi:ATP-binding cassette subfamily C (CFTR/MRP) protein 1
MPSPAKAGGSMGYEKLATDGLDEEADGPYDFRGNPEAQAGCCGRLFIHWLWPLLKLGRSRKLEQTDMYPLLPSESSERISGEFEREWSAAEGTGGAPWRRMLVVLWALEGHAFMGMFFIKLLGDVFRFVTPAALQQIIGWLGDEDAPAPFWAAFVPPAYRGIYYVFIMTGATVAQCFCYSNSNLRGNRVGVHIRSAITVAVYRKSLSQALCARGETTTGKLVNLIASDATRVMWCIPWLHFLPTGLFQLIGSLVFLYSLLGPSILAGLGVTLLTTPLMSFLVKKNNEYNRVVLLRRDTRVSRVNELVGAIKLVKSNACESSPPTPSAARPAALPDCPNRNSAPPRPPPTQGKMASSSASRMHGLRSWLGYSSTTFTC